jgi:hypothetical protein
MNRLHIAAIGIGIKGHSRWLLVWAFGWDSVFARIWVRRSDALARSVYIRHDVAVFSRHGCHDGDPLRSCWRSGGIIAFEQTARAHARGIKCEAQPTAAAPLNSTVRRYAWRSASSQR